MRQPLFSAAIAALVSVANPAVAELEAGPEDRTAEAVKSVVIEVARERSEALAAAGFDTTPQEADLSAAQARPASGFLRPSPDAAGISAIQQPRTVTGNPYISQLAAGAEWDIKKGDAQWPPITGGTGYFKSDSRIECDVRTTAIKMDALWWLFVNPASPMRHDPRILGMLLRRAHAYVDALLGSAETKGGQVVFDDFAIAPASLVLRELPTLLPGLLLPDQRERWDRAARMAGEKILAHAGGHAGRHAKGYPNIDLSMSYELLNFGLYLKDERMLAASRELLDKQAGMILPDGGTHYIWSQNESPGYHDTVAMLLARIHEVTGEDKPVELLKRLEWYGPVSIGRLGEFWTAPAWKQAWNTALGGIVGGEYVIGVTSNPLLRGMAGEPPSTPKRMSHWHHARNPVSWYQAGISPRALPDNVTYPDRNIEGPRAWHGRFTYAATARPLPPDEPGHATIMGAMTTSEDFNLQAIVMGVYPRILTGKEEADPRSWSWVAGNPRGASLVGRTVSGTFVEYEAAPFGGATAGKPSGWAGRQVWLGLPDRVVGLLEIAPGEDAAPAHAVEAVVRLGTGGTIFGPPIEIQPLPNQEWRFGDLIVRLEAADFGEPETRIVPFRSEQAPFYDVFARTGLDPQRPRRFLVEIRPARAAPAAVRPLDGAGLPGFMVSSENRAFAIAANPTGQPVELEPFADAAGVWMIESGGSPSVPRATGKSVLAPKALAVWIKNPSDADKRPGWSSYQDLVSTTSQP